MTTNKSGIYTLTNLVNGFQYVGSTVNFDKRKTRHFWELENNRHHNSYLQRAYNKYGREAFHFDVLECVDLSKLKDVEQRYLDSGDYPYNLLKHARGGSVKLIDHPRGEEIRKNRSGSNNPNWGKPVSEERRQRQSDAISGENNPMWGKKHSEETIKKMSEAKRGKTFTEEHKRKLSESRKGKKASEETRKKLSSARSGRKLSEDQVRRLREDRLGENNPAFKGWYVTPFGKFSSPFNVVDAAGNPFPSTSLHRICHNSGTVIRSQSYSQSVYLKNNHDSSVIGKTYAELGFGYEPKS